MLKTLPLDSIKRQNAMARSSNVQKYMGHQMDTLGEKYHFIFSPLHSPSI